MPSSASYILRIQGQGTVFEQQIDLDTFLHIQTLVGEYLRRQIAVSTSGIEREFPGFHRLLRRQKIVLLAGLALSKRGVDAFTPRDYSDAWHKIYQQRPKNLLRDLREAKSTGWLERITGKEEGYRLTESGIRMFQSLRASQPDEPQTTGQY